MRPVIAALACLVLLSGCSDADWDHLTSFDKAEPDAVAVAAPVPAAAPSAPDTSFCQHVAAQDATANSFDAATQQRVAQISFAQCMALTNH